MHTVPGDGNPDQRAVSKIIDQALLDIARQLGTCLKRSYRTCDAIDASNKALTAFRPAAVALTIAPGKRN
ncbi:hypothetical protein [Caballeronia sp. dw_19]|uniref:hypothetical protein n=1 Tax=Caballeronia sp. dw_19 TaxID=2719791 RepID=UPI001BD6C242|nr:hypothetical protein [Caballeronia sp. dw_19]